MKKVVLVYLSISMLPALVALAQEGDAKIIQYMDFLQHRELVQKQDLVKFFSAIDPHSVVAANKSTPPSQNISAERTAAGGSSK